MKEQRITLTCDLCGGTCSTQSVADTKWIEISIENKHLDRDWFEKHVCPSCVAAILKQAAK
jgi:hypothetical protein